MGGHYKHVRDIKSLEMPYQPQNPPGRELEKYENEYII